MSSRFSCPKNFSGPPVTTTVQVTIIVYNNVPALVPGAAVQFNGPTGASYSGTTDGSGTVVFPSVGAPALNVTLNITASGLPDYANPFTIETLPTNIVYVVGPPGTATGAQVQLPPFGFNAGGACNVSYANSQPAGIPARPNLRWHRGNFSGLIVPGIAAVPGGSSVPGFLFSCFFDRYSPADKATILAAYAAKGYTHYQLSWPDSRSGNGQSVAQFVATCQAIQAAGFYTEVFLTSKDYDPANMDVGTLSGRVDAVIAALNAVSACDIYCVGWELSLFNDPGVAGGPTSQFQLMIDHISGLVYPARPLYVHFQPDYSSFSPNGDFTNVFWQNNIGKLTGCLWEQNRGQTPDCASLQARLQDHQVRFGGAFGWPTGFDFVAFEQGSEEMFFGSLSEAGGEALGLQAIQSPIPNPGVNVMGYMNGCTGDP